LGWAGLAGLAGPAKKFLKNFKIENLKFPHNQNVITFKFGKFLKK